MCQVRECVRSNTNFDPLNRDVNFGVLEMFFSFLCTEYDEMAEYKTLKKRKRRNSPKKTIGLF